MPKYQIELGNCIKTLYSNSVINAKLRHTLFFLSETESSNLHIRKKRLIDYTPGGNRPVSITRVRYVVDLHEDGERNCGASILSPTIIITAAHCVTEPVKYTIISGSGRLNHGIPHNVTRIKINEQYWSNTFLNDLALLKVFPAIDLVHSPNRHIELHDGNIEPNSLGTISGWGCTHITPTSIIYPDELRSITVPIISESACETLYHGHVPITEKVICTLDIYALKSTCLGDSGNPLVVDGRLLGVHAGNKEPLRYPCVHIKVSEEHHAAWISISMRELNDEL